MVLGQWESIAGNLVLTTELKRKLATIKSKNADVSSVSPSSEQSFSHTDCFTTTYLMKGETVFLNSSQRNSVVKLMQLRNSEYLNSLYKPCT